MGEALNCWECHGVLGWLADRLSRACRWLWGVGAAIEDLDDGREAEEIAEAREAQRALIARVEAAMRDGRITATERAECMAMAQAADRELADVERYDQRENEAHAQIAHCNDRARASLAPLSRGADAAERQGHSAPGRETCAEPPWQVLEREVTIAAGTE